MKRFRNIAVILVIICFVVIIASCTYYNINIGKVSDDTTLKEITIKEGNTLTPRMISMSSERPLNRLILAVVLPHSHLS